ncbi:hypothetical protein BO71DRAFT_408596 [Aspergillus ellipticus CBS 707.79]|uniref:BRCT domain-containing protein n=1 Tax=Aspergillus ellipticus CBS 707.79 TaxID=1448320 RepID=A0A319DDD4_9EURO|nr:hypothetical protein BO71DRAFT_408596 [Aspergillus ellipticus CBS 707.79]
MPNPHPRNPPIVPTNHLTFDVWNTSAAGHQVADSAHDSAWRDTRRQKLARQFGSKDGDCASASAFGTGEVQSGGEWMFPSSSSSSSSPSASSSASALGYNKEVKHKNGGEQRDRDIRSMFGQVKKRGSGSLGLEGPGGGGGGGGGGKKIRVELCSSSPSSMQTSSIRSASASASSITAPASGSCAGSATATAKYTPAATPTPTPTPTPTSSATATPAPTSTATSTSTSTAPSPRPNPDTIPRTHTHTHTKPDSLLQPQIPSTPTKILAGLTIHINGQTTPHISDHKLKHLLVAHGADLAIALHRKVTHLVVGPANAGPGRGGAGGGLAAGKLQKEIQRAGWKGIKLVRVQWVLDSIAAGKRLAESKYAVHLMPNQKSVFGFVTSTSTATATATTATTSATTTATSAS